MSHKEKCADWVEEHGAEDDDGCWRILDDDGDFTDEIFGTEEELDAELWRRAVEIDGPTLYGIDA